MSDSIPPGSHSNPQTAWPSQVQDIRYPSDADQTDQPALFYAPQINEQVPLLVGLHQWSGDYQEAKSIPYAAWCIQKGWAFIHPNFRGPNVQPDATGSPLVAADILSAVDFARKEAKIDPARIYLIGASGGGYTSLLMAVKAPHIWAGVSVWVPICDLQVWYKESVVRGTKYAGNIAQSCGGIPLDGSDAARECYQRSPIHMLKSAKNVHMDINAGIFDGHMGSVPICPSLVAFNALADEEDQITEEQIRYFVQEAKVPASLKGDYSDPLFGHRTVLFRRTSGNTRITIFNGGHEIVEVAGLTWLAKQIRKSSSLREP